MINTHNNIHYRFTRLKGNDCGMRLTGEIGTVLVDSAPAGIRRSPPLHLIKRKPQNFFCGRIGIGDKAARILVYNSLRHILKEIAETVFILDKDPLSLKPFIHA